jgi:hypothetical protein
MTAAQQNPDQVADDLLSGSSSHPSLFTKDDGPGTRKGGVVLSLPRSQQQTDFDTGEPLNWSNGQPMMMAVVDLQHDSFVNDDNPEGVRSAYLRFNILNAVRKALKDSGAQGVRPGGQLYITYTGNGVAQGKKNPPKLYAAEYIPPSQADATADALLSQADTSQSSAVPSGTPQASNLVDVNSLPPSARALLEQLGKQG